MQPSTTASFSLCGAIAGVTCVTIACVHGWIIPACSNVHVSTEVELNILLQKHALAIQSLERRLEAADSAQLHVLNDDEMDVGVGGLVPIGVETKFQVAVEGAKDAKLEVLQDGKIILSKIIESDRFVHQFVDTPKEDTVYRARVISAAEESGFGSSNILALTSPIYVQKLFLETDKFSKHDMWISLQQGDDVQLETPPDNPNAPGVKTLVPEWTF